MSANPELVIDGIPVPLVAGFNVHQTFEELSQGTRIGRFMDGSAFAQTQYRKLLTRISGQGWIPHGLAALQRGDILLMQATGTRSIASASNVINLPSARRSDVTPVGWAIVNGDSVPVSVSMNVDEATLGTVAGASQYHCAYWPEFNVIILRSPLDANVSGAAFRWTLEAEEA